VGNQEVARLVRRSLDARRAWRPSSGLDGQPDSAGVKSRGAAIQRRIRSIAENRVYAEPEAASEGTKVDCTLLDPLLSAPDMYVVKSNSDLAELARGGAVPILTPHLHVIGEEHDKSEFDKIREDWPGVASMGEGRHTVAETKLTLPTERGVSHKTFAEAMQSSGPGILPLENFHTAALGRLTGFLVIWNAHQNEPSDSTLKHLKLRILDAKNLVNAYTNVSVGVHNRAASETSLSNIWGIFGLPFAGPIEKAYGEMADLMLDKVGREGSKILSDLNERVSPGKQASSETLSISKEAFAAVRALLKKMPPIIEKILRASTEGTAAGAHVTEHIGRIINYLGTKAETLRDDDMQRALDQVNPLRELFMAEQLKTLERPGLVKVGRAHLGLGSDDPTGLRKLKIPHIMLYYDAAAFRSVLTKDVKQLGFDLKLPAVAVLTD
jgi:hypothetical protein